MTIVRKVSGRKRSSELFFAIMAMAIAATVFAGFSLNMKIRHLDFGALPRLAHLHAAVFAAWLALFGLQTSLVRGGSLTVHQRLGWVGTALAAAMGLIGTVTVVMAIRRGAVPLFWTPSLFLVMYVLELIAFAGLVTAGVILRNRPEWHKRLLLCTTIMIAAAGVGRLLRLPLMGSWSPIGILFGLFVFVAIGMLADATRPQGIHPAYVWGAGAISFAQILTAPIAASPPILWLTAQIVSR